MLKGKDFEKVTKDEIVQIVSRMESRKDWSEYTKAGFKTELKRFYRWLKGNDKTHPEEVEWIKSKKIRDVKFPEELLNEDDVKKMIDSTNNPRDRAFISSLWESACRPGEMLTSKIKSLEFDEYGAVLIVFGKTGMRRLRLINSARDLKAWKDAHPFKDDSESPLWISTRNVIGKNAKPDALSYVSVSEMIKNVAKQVGIKKRIYPYNFRHSRATFLSKYLTDAELKNFLGHTQESRATAVYIHLSGKDIDDKLLKMYGIKKESLKDLTREKPFITCPRCKEVNDFNEPFCKKCWLPLTPQARKMANVDGGITMYPTMVELMKKHPEIDKNIFREAMQTNNKNREEMAKALKDSMNKIEEIQDGISSAREDIKELNRKIKERSGRNGISK